MAEIDTSVLKGLPAFAGLPLADLNEIARDARSNLTAKGVTVFEQGRETRSFFLLLDGHLQVVKTTQDGRQVVVRYISPGEFFGVAVAMGLAAYPATVVAMVDSVVVTWPSSAWSRIIVGRPTVACKVLESVGSRLQDADSRVVEMSTEQVESRIAHALLRLANQSGRRIDSGVEIAFPITRQDVADMTGTTLHTVSRILSAWEKSGLVASGRKRIVIRDAQRLAELGDG
jgi:CRP-like cAMP-binding protein